MKTSQNGKEWLKRVPLTVHIPINQHRILLWTSALPWLRFRKQTNIYSYLLDLFISEFSLWVCAFLLPDHVIGYYNRVYLFQTLSECWEIRMQEIHYNRERKVKIKQTGYHHLSIQLSLKMRYYPNLFLKCPDLPLELCPVSVWICQWTLGSWHKM